jgi:hypothetical protein
MSPTVRSAVIPDAPHQSASEQRLEALRHAGAARSDPVRFHFIQGLLARATKQPAVVRARLDARIATELAKLSERLAAARLCKRDSDNPPQVATERPSLAALTQALIQSSPDDARTDQPSADKRYANANASASATFELKAVKYFRSTWSALRAEKQLTQAFDQAPDNAGPLNSHHLVLRSLEAMREISPEYLNRFMSHVDALLCLELAEAQTKPAKRKVTRSRIAQKKASKR